MQAIYQGQTILKVLHYFNYKIGRDTEIDLAKLRSKDFYRLLNSKLHFLSPTGTKRWSKTCPTVGDSWSEFFKAVPKLSKENKPREFQFKFLH